MSQCSAPSSPLNDVVSGATEEDAIHALLMLQNQNESSPDEDINISDPKLIIFSDQNGDWYEKVPYPGKYMQYADVFIPLLSSDAKR